MEAVVTLLALLMLVAGCARSPVPPAPVTPTQDSSGELVLQAAREATAMIAKAEATALVLKAQAQATAMVDQSTVLRASATAAQTNRAAAVDTPVSPTAEAVADDWVELISVGYAAEGKLIIVEFHSSRKAADDFWPGRISVTDEASGKVYDSVAVMPLIGPLIARPKTSQQIGSVMLDNTAPGLPPGSLVTVKLAKFQQEHVRVSDKIH